MRPGGSRHPLHAISLSREPRGSTSPIADAQPVEMLVPPGPARAKARRKEEFFEGDACYQEPAQRLEVPDAFDEPRRPILSSEWPSQRRVQTFRLLSVVQHAHQEPSLVTWSLGKAIPSFGIDVPAAVSEQVSDICVRASAALSTPYFRICSLGARIA